jgi:hypothetical protein
MDTFERRVRAVAIQWLRDYSRAPTVAEISDTVEAGQPRVAAALRSLADQHRLVLVPGTEAVWMAHPFSAVATDDVVTIGARRWFANCGWDGLAILGLLGDGVLATQSPASGAPLRYVVSAGRVTGEGCVHFLVPARSFWDDIGFT